MNIKCKKILSFFLSISLLIGCFVCPVYAQDDKTIVFSSVCCDINDNPVSGSYSSTATENINKFVKLHIKYFGNDTSSVNASVGDCAMYINYPADKLVPTNTVFADIDYDSGVTKASNYDNGSYLLTWVGAYGLSAFDEYGDPQYTPKENGTFAIITFKVINGDITAEELNNAFSFAQTGYNPEIDAYVKDVNKNLYTVIYAPSLYVDKKSIQPDIYTSSDLATVKSALQSAKFYNVDGTTVDLSPSDATEWAKLTVATSEPALTAGTNYIIASYNGKTATFDIDVTEVTLSALTVTTQPQLEYYKGQKIDLSDLKVKAKYNDGNETENFTDFTAYINNVAITNETVATAEMNGKEIVLKSGNVSTTTNAISIVQQTITPTIEPSAISDQQYTGAYIEPEVTVKYNSTSLTKDTDYSVSYNDNINCGVASVVISPKSGSDYTFAAITKNFNITATAGSVSIQNEESLNRTYDRNATVDPTVTKNNESATVVFEYYDYSGDTKGSKLDNKPINAGKYLVVASLPAFGNYGSAYDEAVFTISQKTVTVSGFNVSDKKYDGTTNAALITSGVHIDGVCQGDTLDITSSAAFVDENVGENKTVNISLGALIGSSKDNYIVDYEGSQKTTTASITKADQHCTIEQITSEIVYNASAVTAKTDNTGNFKYTKTLGDGSPTVTWKVGEQWVDNAPKDAGDYQIKVTLSSTENCSEYYTTAAFSIKKAPLTVTANAKEIKYKDAVSNAGVTYTGFISPDKEENSIKGSLEYDYSYEQSNNQKNNVGSYVITPKGITATNYAITFVAGTLTVSPKAVNSPTFVGVSDQVYTSKEITFAGLKLKDGDDEILDSEYSVAYSSNTNAGIAEITITDKENGNYTVSGTTTFAISQRAVSDANVTVTDKQTIVVSVGAFDEPSSFTYGVDTITGKLEYVITPKGGSATDKLTSAGAINVLKNYTEGSTGTIAWTFTPDSNTEPSKNYKDTKTGTIAYTMAGIEFKVGEVTATNTNALSVDTSKAVYGTKWNKIISLKAIEAKVNGQSGNENKFFYEVKNSSSVVQANDKYSSAGAYTLTVYYTGTIGSIHYPKVEVCQTTVAIAQKEITLQWSNTSLTYKKENQKPTATIMSGLVDSDKLDVTVSGEQMNASTGAYTATASITSNDYKLDNTTSSTSFTIGKKTVGITWTNKVLTYSGVAQSPTAVVNNLCNGDTLTATVSGSATNVGTKYKAEAIIDSTNYALDNSKDTEFSIVKKPIELTWSNTSLVYNGKNQTPSAVVKAGELCQSDSVSVTVTGEKKNVGTGYTATATIPEGNYVIKTGFITTTFAITQKEITISGITAENKVYDATTVATLSFSAVKYNGICENDSLTVAAVGTFIDKNVADGKQVDISNIVLGGTSVANYKLKDSDQQGKTTANITAKAVTIDQSHASIIKEYDGNTSKGTLSGYIALNGVYDGDKVSVVTDSGLTIGVYTGSAVNDNYSVTLLNVKLSGDQKNNYSIASTYTFTGAKIKMVSPKLSNVDMHLPATAQYDGNEKYVTANASGSGLGTITVWYKQFKDGKDQDVTGATAKTTKPVDAGKYYVEVSFAAGDNFEATTQNLTSSAWVVEITRADVNFTLTPTAVTFLPGNVATKVAVGLPSGYASDANKGITYSSNSNAVYVDTLGNITAKAQTSTAVTITVSTKETNNYKSTNASISVKSWIEPIAGVQSLTSMSAVVDNQTIKIAGVITAGTELNLTLTPATGVNDVTGKDITLQSTEIGKKVERVVTVAGVGLKYTIDTTNVVAQPNNIKLEKPTKATEAAAVFDGSTENKTAIETAVNDSATKTTGLQEAAAKTVIEATNTFKNTLKADDAALVSTYAIKIETKIIAESYTGSSVTLEIEPTYIIEAQKQNGEVITSSAAISLSGKEFDTPITVSVKLPAGFKPNYAKHIKNINGKKETEYLKITFTGTDPNRVATWQQYSFSEVELISDNPQTEITFYFEDGHTDKIAYDLTNRNVAFPTDSATGKKYNGWTITTAGLSKTAGLNMTEEILRMFSGKSATAKARLDSSSPVNPNPGPSGPGGGGMVVTDVSYNVNVVSNANCKITANPTSAKAGETITLSVTPNTGYELSSLNVKDDTEGTSIALTKTASGAYTFTMPAGSATVSVAVKKTEVVPQITFVDVPAGSYFEDAVKWAVAKNVTKGSDETHFAPEESCTRAQVVTFLYRAAGSPRYTGSNIFKDIKNGDYYYDAVLWAYEKGITSGTDASHFGPNETCSRAQIVTFLSRYAGAQNSVASTKFTDVKTNAYYALPVAWAVENGITSGVDAAGTKFDPNGTCTRAQVVTFLYRYATKVESEK